MVLVHRVLFGILTLACVVSCAFAQEDAPSPSNGFLLDEVTLAQVTARANAGDLQAMNELFMHYSVGVGDEGAGLRWLEKLGDAGDKDARHDVLCYYVRHRDQPNRLSEVSRRWKLPPRCSRASAGAKLLELDLAAAPADHYAISRSGFTIVVGPGECSWEVQVFAPGDREHSDNLLLPPASEWEKWNGVGSIASWICAAPDDVDPFPGNDREIGVRGTEHRVRIELLKPKSPRGGKFSSGRMRICWYE